MDFTIIVFVYKLSSEQDLRHRTPRALCQEEREGLQRGMDRDFGIEN